MSDILFRYLLMARQRDHSSYRRFFARNDQLLGAGVEQLVESAASRVSVRSQHERHRIEDVEVPASEHHSVRFYDAAEPEPPETGQFEERHQVFPLRRTLVVDTCSSCLGKAKTPCGRCHGQKQLDCRRCRGSGRSQSVASLGRSGFGAGRCDACGGSGRRRCPICVGSGIQVCVRCKGEGETAKWKAENYWWSIEDRSASQHPLEDPRLVEAFESWFETGVDQVESLAPEVAAEHLGFESPDSQAVVARAAADLSRLEEEARESADRYLFHRTECLLSPAGYTVVREAGRAHYFHLVGRGEKARNVEPRERLDPIKTFGWLGLGGTGLVGWEATVRLIELFGPKVLDAFQIAAAAPVNGLATLAATSGVFLLAGIGRMRRCPPPVLTVGLFPASGQPTPYLTCLAYLGSYCQRLVVLDRIYDVQLERLLGTMRSEGQSESLVVELGDGRRVRLVEVARPARLSDEQLGLAAEAFDAVVILEEKEASEPAEAGRERSAIALEARLRTIADHLPATGRRTSLGIGLLRVDRAVDADLEDETAQPLEAIRAAFVEALDDRSGWAGRYERLWQPIETLL